MKRAIYQPVVTLDDDGTVDVDFADSYIYTVDDKGDQIDDNDFDGLLDKIIGDGTSADKFYLDAHQGGT